MLASSLQITSHRGGQSLRPACHDSSRAWPRPTTVEAHTRGRRGVACGAKPRRDETSVGLPALSPRSFAGRALRVPGPNAMNRENVRIKKEKRKRGPKGKPKTLKSCLRAGCKRLSSRRHGHSGSRTATETETETETRRRAAEDGATKGTGSLAGGRLGGKRRTTLGG